MYRYIGSILFAPGLSRRKQLVQTWVILRTSIWYRLGLDSSFFCIYWQFTDWNNNDSMIENFQKLPVEALPVQCQKQLRGLESSKYEPISDYDRWVSWCHCRNSSKWNIIRDKSHAMRIEKTKKSIQNPYQRHS